jgi:hypothetical protein
MRAALDSIEDELTSADCIFLMKQNFTRACVRACVRDSMNKVCSVSYRCLVTSQLSRAWPEVGCLCDHMQVM